MLRRGRWTPTETAAALAEIQSAKAQLAELEARLLAHADRLQVAGSTAASSTANWHAVATRTTRSAAHRAMRTARGLDQHEPTRAALADGRLQLEQAEVILRALEELPADLDTEILEEAETRLLDLAADHDAKALRVLGRRILEVVSPETADAHQARLLEKEERAAAAATRLTLWDDGHGKVHGRFTLDTLTGAALKKALWAIAAPRHQASKGRSATGGTAAHSGAARPGVRRVHPALPRQPAAEGRWAQRHRRGHHDPGHPARWPQGRPARHRRDHQPRRGPPAGLPGRDHPRRPRRELPGPRPGPQDPVPHRGPADRQDHRGRRLPEQRLRPSHPGRATCTTRSAGPTAAAPTATAS